MKFSPLIVRVWLVAAAFYGVFIQALESGHFIDEKHAGVSLYWALMPSILVAQEFMPGAPEWVIEFVLPAMNILLCFLVWCGGRWVIQGMRNKVIPPTEPTSPSLAD